MIYKIQEIKNELIEKAHNEAMKNFNDFFGINWTKNTPNICILDNRKEIDMFWEKSERWVIGFAKEQVIYVLDNEKMETESSHKKHSNQEYSYLIKHEICHLFYSIVSCGFYKPIWLTEGVSVYLSGQLKEKKPVKKFGNFLNFYDKGGAEVYSESGKVVMLLVENFGKKKLLKLISDSKKANNKNEFSKLFKKIHGFDLNYRNFNNLLNKQN